MDARPELGRQGEAAAVDRYRRLRFRVVDRNYRCSSGEIDIVARKGSLLVFCEVKTRRSDRWGQPSQAVDWRKQMRLKKLAAHWLRDRKPGAVEVRFDVISVIVGDHGVQVTHLPEAF
jgi:putative endonuclease